MIKIYDSGVLPLEQILAREEDRHALTPDFRVLDDSEAALIRRRVLDRTLSGFYESLTPGGEQLAEVREAMERNYEWIVKQIWCDSCEIQKIDINFAPAHVLERHPYMAPRTLRRLLKRRQLKGGWNTAEELIEQHIMTREEAARLAPYLVFGQSGGPSDE